MMSWPQEGQGYYIVLKYDRFTVSIVVGYSNPSRVVKIDPGAFWCQECDI